MPGCLWNRGRLWCSLGTSFTSKAVNTFSVHLWRFTLIFIFLRNIVCFAFDWFNSVVRKYAGVHYVGLGFAFLQNYVKPWQLYCCKKLLHETACWLRWEGASLSLWFLALHDGKHFAFCILIQCVDRRLLLWQMQLAYKLIPNIIDCISSIIPSPNCLSLVLL